MTDLAAAALRYAVEFKWPVFPVHSVIDGRCTCGDAECGNTGKHPRTAHGVNDATSDPEQIKAWWRQMPDSNIGLACGEKSGIDALDIDPRYGGDESLFELEQQHSELPRSVTCLTGGGGAHIYGNHVSGLKNSSGAVAEGIDFKTDGGYVVLPPSHHVSGRSYSWEGASLPGEVVISDFPQWLLSCIQTASEKNGNGHTFDEKILPGNRHTAVLSMAGTLRRRGLSTEVIGPMLSEFNQRCCEPPLPEQEVRKIAESIGRYPAGDPIVTPRGATGLQETLAVFQKWLHMNDPGIVEVTLAAIAANRIEGDPVFLMLVGPPGCGKTETLQSLTPLPNVHLAGTLTEAALLSGTPSKDKSSKAKGGLLREIGAFGYLVCKDFTSVLSMNRDSRSSVLAALREIYDGSWTRHVGSDGGRSLHWSGKVAMLCGCTPAIDSLHAVMSAMGERFMFYRITKADEYLQSCSALNHLGHENTMRRELTETVQQLFSRNHDLPDVTDVIGEHRENLIALATLVARCRSTVERDSYSRDITLIPGSEAPTRIVLSLAKLFAGLIAIGVEQDEAWRVIRKVGMDCLPSIRKTVFDYLLEIRGAIDTAEIATALSYPTSTTRRTLEDLTAHGIVHRYSVGKGKANLWQLTDWTREKYLAAGFSEVQAEAI